MIRHLLTCKVLLLSMICAVLPAQGRLTKLDLLGSFRAIGGNFHKLAFSRDGGILVTAGESGDLIAWDVKQRQKVFSRPSLGSVPQSLAVNPAATHVLLACGRPKEGTWSIELKTGAAQRLDETGASSLAFSPDGLSCAWVTHGAKGSRLSLLATNALIGFVVPAPQHVDLPFRADGCVFSADSSEVAVSKGRLLRGSPSHLIYRSADLQAKPSFGSGHVIAYQADGGVIFVDAAYRLQAGDMQFPARSTWAASLDGSQVASRMTGKDGLVERHTLPKGKFVLGTRLQAIAISSQGVVAVSDLRGRLHLIDGEEISVLTGHDESGLSELIFSADGRFVAAAGPGSVTMANLRGEKLRSVFGRFCVAPGPLGSEFFLASPDGIWRFHAAAQTKVGDLIRWPTDLDAFGPDDFGAPSEVGQRLRSLIQIGAGSKFLVRVGERPRVSLFDSLAGTLTPVRGEWKHSRNVETVQVDWSSEVEHAYLLEIKVDRRSGRRAGTKGGHVLRSVNSRGEDLSHAQLDEEPLWFSLSPDGQRMLLVCLDRALVLLESKGLEPVFDRTVDTQFVWSEYLSSKRILAHDGKAFFVLDAWTLKVVDTMRLPGKSAVISVAALGPKRKRIAVVRRGIVEVFAVH